LGGARRTRPRALRLGHVADGRAGRRDVPRDRGSLMSRPGRRQCLLPDDAYPADPSTGAPMDEARRARVDDALVLLLAKHPVPQEPGTYVDGQGDRWVLDAEGGWTDHQGVRRDSRYTPIIAMFIDAAGPFVRVDEA